MDQIQVKLETLHREISVEGALREEKVKALQALAGQVSELEAEGALLTRVDEVLLLISSKILGESVETLDKLLEAGLNLVFHDQRLSFETQVDRARGKTAVNFHLTVDGIKAPIMDSFGGGVLVVAGILLRVVTIMILGLRRELLLDESLSDLHAQYVPAASKLLKKLAKELGFTVLVVTHDPGLAAEADTHYEARPGRAGTEFHRVAQEKS